MKRRTIAALLASSLAFASAHAQMVSRMYDLRELAAALPDPDQSSSARVPILSDIPILGSLFRSDAPAPDAKGETTEERESATDRLVLKLSGFLAMSCVELVDNVYFVDGDEPSHTKFAEALSRVQSLYADRVLVETTCKEVDAGVQVKIGEAPPEGGEHAVTSKAVTARRGIARLQATRAVTYVARWTPIVGDGSVGLEPGVASVTDGIALEVRVGGTVDEPRVGVRGVISNAQIESVKVPGEQAMTGDKATIIPGGLLDIGLPRIERRVVDSEVSAPHGRAAVVAVVPAFEEGKQIVVSVSVKNAPAPK